MVVFCTAKYSVCPFKALQANEMGCAFCAFSTSHRHSTMLERVGGWGWGLTIDSRQ